MAPERFDRVTGLQLDVLRVLWELGEATVSDTQRVIAKRRRLAPTTVATLLKRLEEKGWIRRQKGPVGKAFVYEAARRPRPTQRRVVGELVTRIFGGDSVALVASLFESQPPSADEVAELQALLDRLRGETDGKKRESSQ